MGFVLMGGAMLSKALIQFSVVERAVFLPAIYLGPMTERLPFHFSLSCIGEGNGNPLQCSCLENPRDGGARWARVSGVTQSRAQLK